MAKKLTNEVLEKMVYDVLNESENVSEVLGAIKDFFGSKGKTQTPGDRFKKGPKLGGAVSDMEQLLNMIQLSPKVPVEIKEFAADVLIKPRTPTAKYGSQKVSTADLPEVPAANVTALPDELAPTVKKPMPVAPTVKSQDDAPTVKTGEVVPSPQAVGGPNKGRPAAPALSPTRTPGRFAADRRSARFAENKMIESLVAEVLEEIAKKGKKDSKQQPKADPKKTGKK